MKVIVVSAHPDDMEMSCSGYLLKLQDQGADIISIITVKPSAETNSARSKHIVEQEMFNSYSLSEFQLRVFDTPLHNNGRPNLTVDNNTMTDLSKLVEACDLAIIPFCNDSHQDHRSTFQLVYPLLVNQAREIWSMQSVPYCYNNAMQSDITADISDYWSKKIDLLNCYSSYFNNSLLEKVETSNKHWAGKINTKYAEPFQSICRTV
jgi:LmbE family N-acetylglucosaminyl deacetylase